VQNNHLLNDFAVQHGITLGVCDAAPLFYFENKAVPFVRTDKEKRTDPCAVMPGCTSIIVIGVPIQKHDDNGFPKVPETTENIEVSSLVFPDYHKIVKSILYELAQALKPIIKGFKHRILVDSGSLDERQLAARAGIGVYGKNGLIISPEFGSWFNIGIMLTNITHDAMLHVLNHSVYTASADACGFFDGFQTASCPSGCDACIQACPTGAIAENGSIHVDLCISYLTQKDTLTEQESALLHNQLFGCDVCRQVCPMNASMKKQFINRAELLSMSDDEILEHYAHTGIMWRGAGILRRNAKL